MSSIAGTGRSGGSTRAANAAPRTWSSGLWGMALLLTTEAALFGVAIASYFYLRFDAVRWPPAGVADPSLLWPFTLLGLLVATGVPMVLAARSARRRSRTGTVSWLALALTFQTAYLTAEVVLFRNDLGELAPSDSAYGSAYFTLLGLHHAHVAVGVLLVAFVLARSATGLTAYRVRGIAAVTLYWLVIDALAVAVTLTLLSPAL